MAFRRYSTILAELILLALTRMLPAQDPSPVFRLQPGMVTTDFVSAPEGVSSGTGFNLRFSTTVEIGRSWLRPVFGVNLVPYGTTGYSSTSTNAPSVFIGNIFPVLNERRAGGWLRVDAPLLWYYTYDGGGAHSSALFGRDAYIELAFTVPIGSKLLRDLGPQWKRLEVYALLDQNLTPNPDRVSTITDHFNPIALYGLSIRFGGRQ